MTHPLPGDIFRSGQVLNNTYEIEEVLGRGGTGEVYRARNQITGRIVAVKALNRAMSVNDAYIELMRREEEMRSIASDAVVRYTDCARSDEGHVYLVMDYVDGTPLSAWLERGGADPADMLIVARRVAEGLVATHARNIVHRDLSPDNIILRRDDPAQAVIIDFGIAKDANVGARTIVGENFAGKYEYAAPEQLHGRADARSDLYALGASLLATFRGAVPDVGRSPGEIITRKQEPLDVSGVPDPLRSLIVELTNPDPARRLPSAEALVKEIDRLGSERMTLSPLPAKRRRWWLLLPAAAVAGLGAFWAFGLVDWGPSDPESVPLVLDNPPEAVPQKDAAMSPGTALPPDLLPLESAAVPPSGTVVPLALEPLRAAAAGLATCGPIEVLPGPGPDLTATGWTLNQAAADELRLALEPLIGDRRLRTNLQVLNSPICTVLQALPSLQTKSPIKIELGYADRPEPNLAGEYRSGDQPRLSLQIPESVASGFVWVVLVDVSSDVLTLLPTQNNPETSVSAYSPSSQGTRAVPLNTKLEVTSPYGKSMVLAILSDQPLFPAARPGIETDEVFAASLEKALVQGVRILSFSEQLIETRE